MSFRKPGEALHAPNDAAAVALVAAHGAVAGAAAQRQSEEGERPADQGLALQPSQQRGPIRPRGPDQPSSQRLINYYGAFYRSELRFLAWRINEHLACWAMQKFKRFRGKCAKAMEWLQKVYQRQPDLFAHWQLIVFTASRTVGAG